VLMIKDEIRRLGAQAERYYQLAKLVPDAPVIVALHATAERWKQRSLH
jgi:hypothetical protein